MKKLICSIVACTGFTASYAQLPPSNSDLYLSKAQNCKTVDLKTWSHPAKKVLLQNQITIQKVQICNNNKYPVFIGESRFDLQTQPNQKFSSNFFNSLLKANGNWNYAFVDTNSQQITYVDKYAKGGINYSYENY